MTNELRQAVERLEYALKNNWEDEIDLLDVRTVLDALADCHAPAADTGQVVAWMYEIQHGPDGETNYAWLYEGERMVATLKTFDAIKICNAFAVREKIASDPAPVDVETITPAMVNAAWNEGKDRRMSGMPNDFRAVLEAALRKQEDGE